MLLKLVKKKIGVNFHIILGLEDNTVKIHIFPKLICCCCCSITKSCPALCNPMTAALGVCTNSCPLSQ